ncbi:hypothetical protein HW49_00205 [Porphyromonadaceae bacterium COT-184 OH4590]|nr:hypothetical protein HW49_00205 [Porphyromonadaceae bacterium COT-184 OH4590]
MNYIENLLQGQKVEWKTLGELVETITAPLKVKKEKYQVIGKIPIIDQGEKFIAGYIDEGEFLEESEYIIFGDHSEHIKYVDFAFVQGADGLKILKAKKDFSKYLYYAFQNFYRKEGNYKRHWSSAKDTEIPIHPLEVQQEIANILDTFTTLEAELDCRKRQYHHYRDTLLTFGDDVEWKTLGEVGEFIRGTGLQKKDFTETGVPAIHYGQIYTKYGNSVTETISFVSEELAKKLRKASKNDLVIAGVSENVEDVCKCLVWKGNEDVCVSGDTFIFKHNQNADYIGHLLRTNDFFNYKKKYAIGAKVTRLRAGKLKEYKIPLPPLEEQKRIVNILDKFDTLTNSITEGLPKEIELRRKQYEYYREQLLMFNYQ